MTTLRQKNQFGIAGDEEHIILIGCNTLSSLYMKLLKACAPHGPRVVAVLDSNSKMTGRSLGEGSSARRAAKPRPNI